MSREVPEHDDRQRIEALEAELRSLRARVYGSEENETRLRLALEASGMGTWSWRIGDDFVIWDERLCAIFGVDESNSRLDYPTYLGFIPDEDKGLVTGSIERALATGRYEDFEHRIARPDGSIRRVFCKGDVVRADDGAIVGLRGGVFDITERYRLEEQLHQARKMEAIGRLTAGIAHNFNNLLGIILPSVDLLRRGAADSMAERLDDIEHSALRATEMVRELTYFAKGVGGAARSRVDLVALVGRLLSMCRGSFDPSIAFELSAAPGVPDVSANAGQIEQVLLNVCLNARDALEDARTTCPKIAICVEVTPTNVVRIRIDDNGPGMDEKTRAHVFEPFFTTKESHRGTGLGLSTAYAIVHEHGGSIECESRVGVGTAFVIDLPVADETTPLDVSASASGIVGGDERILIVDDEPGIRRVVRAILEGAGYDVYEARDGDAGLRALSESGAPFDLVIVDRSMPGLSGDDLIEAIAARHGVPVLVLTGHPAETPSPHAVRVLAKPISSAGLLEAVRVAFDSNADSGEFTASGSRRIPTLPA